MGSLINNKTGEVIKYNKNPARSKPVVSQQAKKEAENRYQTYVEKSKPFWQTWFQDKSTNDTVVDSTTGTTIQVNKPTFLAGGVKSSAAGYVNSVGTLLDAVNQGLNTAENYSSDYASRQVQRMQESLQTGRTSDGRILTPTMRKTLESQISKYQRQATKDKPDGTFEERHPVLSSVQNTVEQTADDIAASAQRDTEAAKEGLGKFGQFMVDTGVAGTQLAGDVGLALLTGGSALVPMAVRSFGGAAQEARQSGASLGNQVAYGLGSAALSTATEKISNVAAPFRKVFGAGAADKLSGKLVKQFGESTAVKTMSKLAQTPAGKLAASALSEGSEEYVEDIFQPVLQRATYDPDASFDPSQALYDAAIGAALGGVGGAVDVAGSRESRVQSPSAPTEGASGAPVSVDTPATQTAIQSAAQPTVQPATDVMGQETKRMNGQIPQTVEDTAQTETLLDILLKGKRVDQTQANNQQFDALAERGDIGVDAGGKLYQMNPSEHIDQRNQETVRNRSVNAFQYDHPELQSYMKQAAEFLIADADLSLQFPMTRSYERGMQGNKVNQSAQTSAFLREAMDETGLSRNQIIDAAQRIIHDQGQENVVAAKSVELILDRMLTDGYTTMYGETVSPNEAYISAKESIAGAAPEQTSKPLPIWDMPEAQTDGLGAANAGFLGDTERGFSQNVATDPSMEQPLRENFQEDPEMYFRLGNRETLHKAQSIFDLGIDEARSQLERAIGAAKAGQKLKPEMVPLARMVANELARQGDVYGGRKILTDISIELTQAGQLGQAAAILRNSGPAVRTETMEKLIQQAKEKLSAETDVEVDQDLLDAYANATTDAESDAAIQAIQESLAAQIPSTMLDKWTALRYVNMLGNLKTQIRNVSGNVGMLFASRTSNAIAASLETIASKASGGKTGRTRSVTVDKALRDAATKDFDTVRREALGEVKYSITDPSAGAFVQGIQDKQRVFKSSILEGYRKATNWLMNNPFFGDEAFIRKAYSRALSGYLKANGVTAEQFQDQTWQKEHADLLENAREFAVKDAQEVTFRDQNTFSDWISRIGRRPDTPKIIRALSAGNMPFRRTPANVFLRAVEYSPAGIVNAGVQAARAKAASSSLANRSGLAGKAARSGADITVTDVIDTLSKGLTGTGIFVLGMALKNAGLLRGGPDDDEKQAEFDDLTGHQDFSLELPNGTSITMDWLSPISMPLFMGAELERLRQDGDIQLKDLEQAFTSMTDVMIQMSMLQGINDSLDNLKYSDYNLMQFAASAALDYLTQGLTNTLVGQARRTFTDDGNSMTYVDQESPIPDWLQRELGSASKRSIVPAYNQIPYIDAWGRTQSSGDPLLNAANNFLNPAYTSQIEVDAVEQELQDIKDSTGDSSVFPSRADKSFTVNGKEKQLTAEEYEKYAKKLGSERYSLLQEAMQTDYYRSATSDQKAEYIADLYSYAGAVAKSSVSSYQLEGWQENASTAQQDIGVSPAEYIALYQKYGSSIMSGKAYEKTKEAVKNGFTVDEYATAKTSANTNGKSGVNKEEATSYVNQSGYTGKKKADLWDLICTTSKNNPFR